MVLLALIGGCASLEKAPATPPPEMRIVAMWGLAEGPGLDHETTRGFAAQVMFLRGDDPVPVEVAGKIRIRLYDDGNPPVEQEKPIHQFDFDAEVWKLHLRQGALGPTYHVFIPYVRPGDRQTHCRLQVQLMSGDDCVAESEKTGITLRSRRPAAGG
jgi:hypothetical protein